MTTVRPMIAAVLALMVSACTSAGEKRADELIDSLEDDAGVAQREREEPRTAAALPTAQPENTGELTVDPLPDSDGDLVADANDQCPESEAGTAVDADGCAVFSGALEDLVFAPDDDALNEQARQALDALIIDLESYPDVVIAVDGHTDNRGLASNNLDLSKRRVIAVVRYLVEQGIPAYRLKPYGYGESRPLKSNATVEGRRSNRRIEVRQVKA